jgi:L-amino acid N-acyltransferase YncA
MPLSAIAFTVRPVEAQDAAQIAAIYAPIVSGTAISFETLAPSPGDIAQRIAVTLQRYPWLVAESDGVVLGYAYASEHRQRAAYRWSVDVAAYVAETARGKGVAMALYQKLIAILTAQGFRAAFAGIALPNAASVRLHESAGFLPVGIYKAVGFKLDAWRDVGWWGLDMGTHTGAPAEPTDFSKLRLLGGFSGLLE